MPKFTIESSSPLSGSETYEKLKTLLDQDPDLRKFDPKYQCEFDDANLSGKASGKQFSAQLSISESGGSSHVQIEIEIPFVLSPFKGKIKSLLEGKVGKLLS